MYRRGRRTHVGDTCRIAPEDESVGSFHRECGATTCLMWTGRVGTVAGSTVDCVIVQQWGHSSSREQELQTQE